MALRKFIPILFGCLLALTSCNTLMPLLFGVQKIDGYNAEQCENFYKKLPKDFVFTPLVCDEAQFFQVRRGAILPSEPTRRRFHAD